MDRVDQERLQAAKLRARAAIRELLSAQLHDRDLSTSQKVHLRSRFANSDRVVNRIVSVTLLDRLELADF
jgi:hypothetical protein